MCFSIPDSAGCFFGKTGINQNYIIACIYDVILKRSTIFDIVVEILQTAFSPAGNKAVSDMEQISDPYTDCG